MEPVLKSYFALEELIRFAFALHQLIHDTFETMNFKYETQIKANQI